jgi:peptidoglycan/LPS O-acetylase OafA/YrhL
MAHTRQEWRDAMFRRADEAERPRAAAVTLSGFAGAILLVAGWNGGHIHNRFLVALGAALLLACLVQFALFVLGRLRRSP